MNISGDPPTLTPCLLQNPPPGCPWVLTQKLIEYPKSCSNPRELAWNYLEYVCEHTGQHLAPNSMLKSDFLTI